MQTPRSALSSRRRFWWLLWLVLLLPIAQTAATLHVLSHAMLDLAGDGSAIDGKPAIDHAHCELCLTAAALTGAAPPAAAPCLPRLAMSRALPRAVSLAVRFAATVPAYESRAPPFSVL